MNVQDLPDQVKDQQGGGGAPSGPIYTLMPPPEDGFIIQTGVVSQQKRHRRQSSLNIVQFPDTSDPPSASIKLRRSLSNATVRIFFFLIKVKNL